MKTSLIVFPGSNCDRDLQVAVRDITGKEPAMVWHTETSLPDCDLIVIPGGFTFGDYLRTGAMAANSPIMADVKKRAAGGTPTLGICNGFQILTEVGLLPGVLMRNKKLKFICKSVHLKVERNDTVFTRAYQAGQVVEYPIAHMEGNFFADDETMKKIENNNQVAFRYCTPNGDVVDDANPNGSQRNIAGVYNEQGNVLGLMPHPERFIDDVLGGSDGRHMFQSLVEAL